MSDGEPSQSRSLLITNQTETPLPFQVESFTANVLDLLGLKTGQFEITFLDDQAIHKMNKTHLNHDYPTDIITFELGDTENHHGDLYISIETAQANAITQAHALEDELKTLIIHGLLHLIGYDDHSPQEKEDMFAKQTELLEKANAIT